VTATAVEDTRTEALPDLDAMLAAEPAEDRPPRRVRRPSGAARRKAAAAASGETPAKRAAPKPRAQTTRARKLKEVGALAETLLSLSPQTVADAAVLHEGFPKFADATAAVAEEHPRFGVFLDGLGTGGAIGAMVLTGLAMALPIAANHGFAPAQVATAVLGQMVGGVQAAAADVDGAVPASAPLVDQFGNPLPEPPF
jgi:hypothetical protein